MTNLLDNNLLVYSVCTISVVLIIGFGIKYYSTPNINTPNSPPTFNIRLDQLKEIEIQSIFEGGEPLDQETKEKLDQDLKTILGEEEYAKFQQETQELGDQMIQEVQSLLDNIDLFN